MDSPEVPLHVSSDDMFWGSKVLEIWGAKMCPFPSGIRTAPFGVWEMIVQVSIILPRCSFDAHSKDKGDNKRPLTPMYVQNVKKWQCSDKLHWL